MPYDRFEEDWNGVPAPMVDDASSKNLFNRRKLEQTLHLLPKRKALCPKVSTKSCHRKANLHQFSLL